MQDNTVCLHRCTYLEKTYCFFFFLIGKEKHQVQVGIYHGGRKRENGYREGFIRIKFCL